MTERGIAREIQEIKAFKHGDREGLQVYELKEMEVIRRSDMAEQYEHMTLVVEGNVVVAVDKPPIPIGSIITQVKAGLLSGLFDSAPSQLVNKTVAYAQNLLSAQGWEVTRMPGGTVHTPTIQTGGLGLPLMKGVPNVIGIPGIVDPPPDPLPNRYHIELRRLIRK